MARPIQSYINTLVFTLVVGLLSLLLLLGMIFTTAMGTYAWFVITLEVGFFAIILWNLIQITTYESRVRKMTHNAAKNSLVAQTCPDYFTMSYSTTGETECINVFKGVSPAKERFIMLFVPSTSSEQVVDDATKSTMTRFTVNPPDMKIAMKTFEEKRVEDACKIVQGRADLASSPSEPNNYTVPWTDLRNKCEGFAY